MGRHLKPSEALFASVAAILRPQAKLLIAHGIPLSTVVEMMKKAYVRVADEEYGIGGQTPTDTRVSLLTGVHRKDVRRIRAEGPDEAPVTRGLDALSEVVTRWISDRRYCGRDGRPRALPRHAGDGPGHSFDSLAYGVSSDLKPRTILDELERLGIVRVEEARVVLETEAFIPDRGSDESLHYFGANVRDHILAATHNICGQTPPMLEQSVFSEALSPESANELLHLSRELWSEMLKRMIRRTAELEIRDAAAGRATQRINLGVYFHSETRPPGDGARSNRPARKSSRRAS
jgi:hypothetical protein